MENERNLLEICAQLKEEVFSFIESISPLYPGSEKKVEELSQKISKLIGALKAEGGERLLATAKNLENQLERVKGAVTEYIQEKAKEN